VQHLIRMRWDELNPEEQHQMAIMAGNMLQESARPSEPWGLKSQAAALMAEVCAQHSGVFIECKQLHCFHFEFTGAIDIISGLNDTY